MPRAGRCGARSRGGGGSGGRGWGVVMCAALRRTMKRERCVTALGRRYETVRSTAMDLGQREIKERAAMRERSTRREMLYAY